MSEWSLLGRQPRVACVGVYIVDVLGRVIETLPRGQRSQLIEQITMTVAGTAGAVAVNLARLGAQVDAIGVIGEDSLGDFLLDQLRRNDVAVDRLRRMGTAQTSATILAIDRNGERPAFHVVGANGQLGPADVDAVDFSGFDVLHFGGITAMPGLDGAAAVSMLERARETGLYVSLDMLGIKRDDAAELVRSYLPYVSIFTPNDSEACQLTGKDDPVAAAEELHRWGADTVAVTCGADGAVVVNSDGVDRLRAFPTAVVDTTGCGDALTSATLIGHFLGYDDARAVEFGMIAASLNAEVLGSAAAELSIGTLLRERDQRSARI